MVVNRIGRNETALSLNKSLLVPLVVRKLLVHISEPVTPETILLIIIVICIKI